MKIWKGDNRWAQKRIRKKKLKQNQSKTQLYRINNPPKINEIMKWFLKRINKIVKLLAKYRGKKENVQISHIREGNIITDPSEIQDPMRVYTINFMLFNWRIEKKTQRFLEYCNLPNLNEKEINA